MLVAVAVVIGAVAGAAGAFAALRLLGGPGLETARRTRTALLDEAHRDADATRREAQIEAREQAIALRAELDSELRERRDTAVKIEERVLAIEGELERRGDELARREQGVADREVHLRQLQEEIKALK